MRRKICEISSILLVLLVMVSLFAPSASAASGQTPRGGSVPAGDLPAIEPFVAFWDEGTASVRLEWMAYLEPATYEVYRSQNSSDPESGDFEKILTAAHIADVYHNDTAVQAGATYHYFVAGVDATGARGPAGSVQTVGVPGQAPADDPVPLDPSPLAASDILPPQNVQATSPQPGLVRVTWDAVADAVGYVVYRADHPDGPYGSVAVATNSYTDSTGTEGVTYYYRVASTDRRGTGDYGDACSVTVRSRLVAAVLTATARGTDTIDVAWTRVDEADRYDLYRSTAENGTYELINTTATGDVTTYRDTGRAEGTTYWYYVVARLGAGIGPQSNRDDATTAKTPVSITLTATASGYDTIDLSWTGIANVSYYYIYRSTAPSSGFSLVGGTQAGVTTYKNTGLAENTRYYYYIVAYRNGDSSVQSNTANALTGKKPVLTLTATATGYETIALSWNAVAGANRYLVYRSTSATSGFSLAHQLGNVTSLVDTGRTPNTTYYYYVLAYKDTTQIVRSNTANAKTPLPSLTVSVSTLSSTSLRVTWTKPVGATSYTIYRSTYNGGYVQIGTKGNENTWTDTGLQPNTVYWYKVVANIGSQGVNYGKTSAPKAAAPQYFQTNIDVCKPYQIGLSWMADKSGGVQYYELSYSNTGNANDYRVITTISPSNSIYIPVYGRVGYYVQYQHAVNRTSLYYYRVRALGSDGVWSDYTYAGPASTANVVPCYYCQRGIGH